MTTTRNTPQQRLDQWKDGLDETKKNKGDFKSTNSDKLLYLMHPIHNSNEAAPPPKLTIGSTTDQQICVKSSAIGRVCGRETYKYSHMSGLDKITKGTFALTSPGLANQLFWSQRMFLKNAQR